MNAAAQIIADLDSRGVSIRPDGDLLRLSPRSALTDADRENLRALKTEVLAELHRPSRAAALSAQTRHEPGRLVTHPWIGSEVNDGEVHGILRVVIADYNGNLRAGIRADGDAVLWLRDLDSVHITPKGREDGSRSQGETSAPLVSGS